jgi:hypothetical protein
MHELQRFRRNRTPADDAEARLARRAWRQARVEPNGIEPHHRSSE